KREAEAVTATVGEDLTDVCYDVIQLRGCERHAGLSFEFGDLIRLHIGEGIVGWCRAVRIEPEDAPSQMRVVGCGTAELIIGLPRPEWTARQVLKLSAPTLIADLDVELAVGTKQNLSTIMVAAHGLTGVRLERTQHNDVLVRCQRVCNRVPDIS